MYSRLSTSLIFSVAILPFSINAASTTLDKDASINSMYSWTGFYGGFNVGATGHNQSITDNQAVTFNATIQQVSDPDFSGGLQIGYRFQTNPSNVTGVFGVEFSANFTDTDFHEQYGSPFALYQLEAKNELKNLQLLQLTGGIAADRTLIFLAAGISWSHISGSLTNIDGAPFFETLNLNKTTQSWSLGAGIEYAFNDKVSARVKVDILGSDPYSRLDDAQNRYLIANNTAQGVVGVNYRFG